MIAAADLLLATVDHRGAPPRRPQVGWLSAAARPAVTAVARRLGVDVEVRVVGPDPALDGGLDGRLDGAAPAWDLVTADVSAVGRGTPARLAHLARSSGARCPNTVALGLAADPAAARVALAAAGFPVTDDGGPARGRTAVTVAVARRPSGWWRPLGRTAASDPRVLELAASAAAGLDVCGVFALDLVTVGDGVLVEAVRVGPDPDDPVAVEAHLRGLLDLPLEADPAGWLAAT